MSIFPYLQLSADLLETQFGFDSLTAGSLYPVPYLISAISSPFLGILIDKVGKRALFIAGSSVFVGMACFLTAFMPTFSSPSYWCLLPQCLIGIGYSIYAAALWASIPYVVIPRTIGTAYGLTMSAQQIGLIIAPFCVAKLRSAFGTYFWPLCMLGCFSGAGLLINIWLYIDDISNRDGILNKVDKST